MIPNTPNIPIKQIILAVFAILIFATIFTVNPNVRNERVECLSLPGNPYEYTPQSGHIVNTGLISYLMFWAVGDYRILAFCFWLIILWSVRNVDNWLLFGLFMVLAYRTAVYQHEEVYFGLPFVYIGLISNHQIVKGIANGIALTVRPIYLAYMLPYLVPTGKTLYVWAIGIMTAGLFYMSFLFMFGGSFVEYNNITSIFRGGAKINYSLWFLDYALLILLPIIWTKE